MIWRLVLLAFWGLSALSVLVLVLSAFGNISRQIGALLAEDAPPVVVANYGSCGEYGDCEPFSENRQDIASLQRGARLYADYCAGCHSLGYSRHVRVADDLDIPHNLYEKYLLPGESRIGDLMVSAMSRQDAEKWFGTAPPDLTLITEARGSDWVYTYLKTFYTDASRPWGSNNLVFPQVGMPHVLESLQGEQVLGCEPVPLIAENGGEKRDPVTNETLYGEECGRLIHTAGSGSLSPQGYEEVAYDLVNYLSYVAAPEKPQRHRIGVFVLIYLVIFSVFSYLLYREYRKDYKP